MRLCRYEGWVVVNVVALQRAEFKWNQMVYYSSKTLDYTTIKNQHKTIPIQRLKLSK